MPRFIALLFICLIPIKASAQDSIKVNVNLKDFTSALVDSVFNEIGIDTSNISKVYLSAKVSDWLKPDEKFSANYFGCYDYFRFQPNIESRIDPKELEYVLSLSKNDNKNLYMFLEDNDVKGAIFKIYTDSNNVPVKLEQLGTDININFAKVVAVSYYKNGRISYYHNIECETLKNISVYRFFFYDGYKIEKEIYISASKSLLTYKEILKSKTKTKIYYK